MTASFSTQKILPLNGLLRRIAAWRVLQSRIVFTNGCFDLLHPGHIQYMEEARGLGDKLVVGVNTDRSVQALKGPDRPIQSAEARARVLAGLAAVDAVILFDEDTPLNLIQTVKPDLLVKGGDYQIRDIVGAPEVISWGGAVQVIPFLAGYSTSKIVARIQGE